METRHLRLAALAVLLAVAPLVSASTLQFVSLEEYPGAACVDGSPAGYYWEAAPFESPKSTWIVYLEKGGWCYSEESCNSRCHLTPDLCSTKTWESSVELHGIFNAKDLMLRNANKVYLRYCTSDGHMGDAAAFGKEFRGARVVEAVLTDLVQRRGLGQSFGKELLLFGGGSAGARGAMVHLDYVPGMLGTVAAKVDVVGFLDSPLWIDAQPLGPGDSLPHQAQAVFKYANVSHVGPECVAVHKNEDRWKCIFGEYRMPFVQAPYMLVAAQYDEFQLMVNLPHVCPRSTQEKEFARDLASRTVQLDAAIQSPKHAVFSPACYSHSTSLRDDGFAVQTSAGETMEDALVKFLVPIRNQGTFALFQDSATGKTANTWVDSCSGMSCGSGCSAVSQAMCPDLSDQSAEPSSDRMASVARHLRG